MSFVAVPLFLHCANSFTRGALDFNPLSTIASHLQYWQDEDIGHFILSQLLSRKALALGKSPQSNK